MTEVVCTYFKLKEQKNMNDSHSIPAGQDLIELSEGMYMTHDSSAIVRVFYAEEDEVTFIEDRVEVWDQEQIDFKNNILHDTWLLKENNKQ